MLTMNSPGSQTLYRCRGAWKTSVWATRSVVCKTELGDLVVAFVVGELIVHGKVADETATRVFHEHLPDEVCWDRVYGRVWGP
jgi:hypothetical protein